MPFHDTRFPEDISRGATVTPTRLTDVVTLRSGHEERNTIWANSRRMYDIGLGLRSAGDIYETLEFWEGRRGALHSFRLKDWADFTSKSPIDTPANDDQVMAQITSTTYQLQKVYSASLNPWTRTIDKPVDGTVLIRDNTGALVETTDYTVDYSTGIVTFGTAPTGTPTAGFEFDVHSRFQGNELEINVAMFDQGSIPSIPIYEVR